MATPPYRIGKEEFAALTSDYARDSSRIRTQIERKIFPLPAWSYAGVQPLLFPKEPNPLAFGYSM
jgi:hypothetical protein